MNRYSIIVHGVQGKQEPVLELNFEKQDDVTSWHVTGQQYFVEDKPSQLKILDALLML